MSTQIDRAMDWCNAHNDEYLTLLKELAAIPSPSNHEEKRAEFVLNWLNGIGAKGAYIDDACNVVLPMDNGTDEKYSVFLAHTDVVFPDTDPLPVREENGRLYAPGVGDDTANVVGLLLIIKYIVENGLKPAHPVLFVFNSGEEGLGNLRGSRHICKTFGDRMKQFVSFDAGYTSIIDTAVGSERWKVTCQTIGGHSYGAFGNPNAIVGLAKMINLLDAQPVPQKEGTKTTYNVGMINGGTSVNTIAQYAEMLYEYRSDYKPHLDQMHAQFMDILAQVNNDDTKFAFELLGERPCSEITDIDAENALLAKIEEVIKRFTGKVPPRISGSTDANIPLSMNIPSSVFGMYLGEKAHTREESLDISTLPVGLKTGMTLTLELCF